MVKSEMLLKIAQMFGEQASTNMFVPGFMANYCQVKPLLVVLKAQKELPIIGTGENGSQSGLVAMTTASQLDIANTVNKLLLD